MGGRRVRRPKWNGGKPPSHRRVAARVDRVIPFPFVLAVVGRGRSSFPPLPTSSPRSHGEKKLEQGKGELTQAEGRRE